MAMRKAGTPAKKANGFPAEAGHFYEEVPSNEMEKLRLESAKMLEEDEWEVVDGINFPYPKCA